MNQESKKPAVTIDGKEYVLDDLTANARTQIVNLRLTEQEIARLRIQLAIAQTARAAYARALAGEITPSSAQIK